jgi:DNA repair photolyase
MSLTKSKGNMYEWVTHTHAHLGGECPHRCSYCYVDSPRFGRPEKYKGEIRLIEKELDVNYGTGRIIFVENCNDLFAYDVPDRFVDRILNHCKIYPLNTYVFQTKNPGWMLEKVKQGLIPAGSVLGCTIETNRDMDSISMAPRATERARAMRALTQLGWKTFITLEPILDFDVDQLAVMVVDAAPSFVNIGADSKGHNLPEPTIDKVMQLVKILKGQGIEIREKHNLSRLREAGKPQE